MNTPNWEHRIIDPQSRIRFKGRTYQCPANLNCGRLVMVSATKTGIMIQTGPETTIELLPARELDAFNISDSKRRAA